MSFSAWQVWLIFAIALFVAEMLVPGFFLACFGIGALGSALIALITPKIAVHIVVFSMGTLISFVAVRPIFQKISSKQVKTNIDAYVGLTGFITEAIDPATGQGRVSIGGESWKARSSDNSKLPAGQKVEVVKVDGLCLIVKISA
jgi:membrane protein implicated in regulation of membrane protease activity